jgi:hypothetical protein
LWCFHLPFSAADRHAGVRVDEKRYDAVRLTTAALFLLGVYRGYRFPADLCVAGMAAIVLLSVLRFHRAWPSAVLGWTVVPAGDDGSEENAAGGP